MTFADLYDTLTTEQKDGIERLYAKRIADFRADGVEPDDLTAYESLEKYDSDIESITSYEDILDILG